MQVDQALRLKVLELIGSPVISVYVDTIEQDPAYPLVRVSLVTTPKNEYLLAGGVVGVEQALVQVDAMARETAGGDPYADASELADLINGTATISGLSGFRGSITGEGSPAPLFKVLGIFREDRRRVYDPDELRVCSIQQDYRVWYKQT